MKKEPNHAPETRTPLSRIVLRAARSAPARFVPDLKRLGNQYYMRTAIICTLIFAAATLACAEKPSALEARKYSYDEVYEYTMKRDYTRIPWRSVTITSRGKDIHLNYIVAVQGDDAAKIFDLEVGFTSVSPIQIESVYVDRCSAWGSSRRLVLSKDTVVNITANNLSDSDIETVLMIIKRLTNR